MTPKQKAIVNYLQSNESITFDKVRELIDDHYCNGGKHCSDAMTRMVKQGFIVRVKKGVFSLNKNYRGGKTKNETIPNQTDIFKEEAK